MSLSEPDALLLREDDIVLVPMRVTHSNNHFSRTRGLDLGVSLTVKVPGDPMIYHGDPAERERATLYKVPTKAVDSILRLKVRPGDWITYGTSGRSGFVHSIHGDEVVFEQRHFSPVEHRMQTEKLVKVRRSPPPEDLTPEEQRRFRLAA